MRPNHAETEPVIARYGFASAFALGWHVEKAGFCGGALQRFAPAGADSAGGINAA
jgi:hypothetical protein